MRYDCEVYIRPRTDILDPQGDAVNRALANLGFAGVGDVKVGKFITLAVDAVSAEAARLQLDEMCRKLLANPIIEDFTLKIKE